MSVSRLLLTATLVFAAWASRCGALDVVPEAVAAGGASQRLPPTGPEASAASEANPLDQGAASSSDVSTAAYEEEFAFDDYEPEAPQAAPVNPKATRLFESTW
jgi:hypothetical protein